MEQLFTTFDAQVEKVQMQFRSECCINIEEFNAKTVQPTIFWINGEPGSMAND
jgi:hypothetical protein